MAGGSRGRARRWQGGMEIPQFVQPQRKKTSLTPLQNFIFVQFSVFCFLFSVLN
jgi:hypothetical protein